MRSIEFCNDAFNEFSGWATLDKTIFRRLVRIIEETKREPFGGIGKPEPPKGNLSGK